MAEAGRYRYDKRSGDFVPVPPGYAPAPRKGPILLGDYSAYDCPITGKMIEGRYQHSENLKRHDCRLLEKGETRESARRVQESFDAGLDRVLDKAVGA